MLLLEMQSVYDRVAVKVQEISKETARVDYFHEEEFGCDQQITRPHSLDGRLLRIEDRDNEEGDGCTLSVELEFEQDV